MRAPAGVRVALSSEAGNVAIVRAVLKGFTDAAGLGPELASDLQTSISEACNNVCLHAYPRDVPGPMWVAVNWSAHGVEATVTDRGPGITRIAAGEEHMGLGLLVINALADRTQFNQGPDGGAQVHMFFGEDLDAADAHTDRPGADISAEIAPPADLLMPETGSAIVLWCSEELWQPVLERMLPYMAAAAHFSVRSIERVRSAVGDISERVAQGAEQGWAGARILSSARELELIPLGHRTKDGEMAHMAITDSDGGDLRMV